MATAIPMAADFLIWQKTLGSGTEGGLGVPTGEHAFYFNNLKIVDAAGVASVPEPAFAVLAAGAVSWFGLWRRTAALKK